MQLIDNHNRVMNYLRISVTDRCNLRCNYCMPQKNVTFLPRESILNFSEILELINLFSELGVDKIRFTGGEPFVRRDFVNLLQESSKISSIRELHLTTNAVLIKPYISNLNQLGITGINVSLDTLRKDRFKQLTRRDDLQKVLSNITALLKTNINIKINVVVQNGQNDDEMIEIINYFKSDKIEIRFIEHMPFNGKSKFSHSILINDMETRLFEHYRGSIEKIPSGKNSTAKRFKIKNYQNKVGIIAGFSRLFCDSCNRLRLSSTGDFQTCLYGTPNFNLKLMLQRESKEYIQAKIRSAISERYIDGFATENAKKIKSFESMSKIGG